VEIFDATRPDGLDGWTMDPTQYEVMRAHILDMIDEEAGADGSIALRNVVRAAQDRYAAHPLFPGGRTRNYCTFTKVDLEARCEIERLPRASPQRIRRVGDPPPSAAQRAGRFPATAAARVRELARGGRRKNDVIDAAAAASVALLAGQAHPARGEDLATVLALLDERRGNLVAQRTRSVK
jgi:hypothetical protein